MEIGKIRGKYLFLFVVAVLVLVMGQVQWSKNWSSELITYSQEVFDENVERTIAQADSMGAISIFSKKDSFADANRVKTKEDFSRISDVRIDEIHAEAWEKLFSFQGSNYILLVLIAVIAFIYSETDVANIQYVMRPSYKGRGIRNVRRGLAIIAWCGISCVLIYGVELVCQMLLEKSFLVSELHASVQSIPSFSHYTTPVSIGVYMLIHVGFYWFVFSVMALLIWNLFLWIEHALIAVGTGLLLCVGEYELSHIVMANSKWNHFLFCNVWTFLSNKLFLREYLNLRVFGKPISKELFVLLVMGIILILLEVLAFVKGQRILSSARKLRLDGVKEKIAGAQKYFSLAMMELYKVLISQRGWILIVVLVGITVYQSDYTAVSHTRWQNLYYSFVDRYEGVPSDAALRELEELHTELVQIEEDYREALIKYENKEIGFDEIYVIEYLYASYEDERVFYDVIAEQLEELDSLKRDRKIDGWIVNRFAFMHLFSSKQKLIKLLWFVTIILMAFFSEWQEAKTNMVMMLHSSLKGRKDTLLRKYFCILLVGILTYLFIVLMNISTVVEVYGLSGLGAPIQSVKGFETYLLPINVLGYISLEWIVDLIAVMVAILVIQLGYVFYRNKRKG